MYGIECCDEVGGVGVGATGAHKIQIVNETKETRTGGQGCAAVEVIKHKDVGDGDGGGGSHCETAGLAEETKCGADRGLGIGEWSANEVMP